MNKTNKALSATLALGLGLTLSAAHASPAKITAQSIIVNPVVTELKVDVWTNKDATGNANPVYQKGEAISVGVKVNKDAYVYLFNVNADGAIDLFFPNGYEESNFVKAGTTRTLPGQGAKYTLNIGGPDGQDKLLALASLKALTLDDIAKFVGDQGFAQVGVKGQENLAKALSIVVNPLPASSWVTDVANFRVTGTQATTPRQARPQRGHRPPASGRTARWTERWPTPTTVCAVRAAWDRRPPTLSAGATAGGRSSGVSGLTETPPCFTPTAAAAPTRFTARFSSGTSTSPGPKTARPAPPAAWAGPRATKK